MLFIWQGNKTPFCALTKSESLSKACQPATKKSKPNSSCRSCSWKQIHKWETDIEPPPQVPTIQRWQSPPPASPATPVFWAWQWLLTAWQWLAAGSQHRALDADTGLWKQAVLLAALCGVSQSSAGGHASTRPNTSYYTCPQPDTTTDTFQGTSAASLKLKMLHLNLQNEMSPTLVLDRNDIIHYVVPIHLELCLHLGMSFWAAPRQIRGQELASMPPRGEGVRTSLSTLSIGQALIPHLPTPVLYHRPCDISTVVSIDGQGSFLPQGKPAIPHAAAQQTLHMLNTPQLGAWEHRNSRQNTSDKKYYGFGGHAKGSLIW